MCKVPMAHYLALAILLHGSSRPVIDARGSKTTITTDSHCHKTLRGL